MGGWQTFMMNSAAPEALQKFCAAHPTPSFIPPPLNPYNRANYDEDIDGRGRSIGRQVSDTTIKLDLWERGGGACANNDDDTMTTTREPAPKIHNNAIGKGGRD